MPIPAIVGALASLGMAIGKGVAGAVKAKKAKKAQAAADRAAQENAIRIAAANAAAAKKRQAAIGMAIGLPVIAGALYFVNKGKG